MRRLNRSAKGMTLVEIVISIAAGLIVLFFVLAIFISTISGIDKTIARDALKQEIRTIAEEVKFIVNHHVPPDELNVKKPFEELFVHDRLTIASSTKISVVKCTLSNLSGEEDNNNSVIKTIQSFRDRSRERTEFLGTSPNTVSTSILFAYAVENENGMIIWEDSLPPGSKPHLVEFTITARNLSHDIEPMKKRFVFPLYQN